MALARLETSRLESASAPAPDLSFRRYLEELERDSPADVIHVKGAINPSKFEATAVLQRLEEANRYPLVVFERPLALNGKPSAFPLVTNVFATREGLACVRSKRIRSSDRNTPAARNGALRRW